MRGSNTLFADIFIDEKPVEKQVKGRSASLNSQRNELLVHRFYYHGLKGLRYDLVIAEISKEFFLTDVTIPKVIADNYPLLTALKKSPPSKQFFQKKWPHLVW